MATIKKYNGSTWENAVVRKYGTASEIIVPPTTIYCDGSNITTYTIKGNTVQNGTPTPSNPVDVSGVGVRTENLFPPDTPWYRNNNSSALVKTDAQNDRIKSDIIPISDSYSYLSIEMFNPPQIDGWYLASIRFYGDDLTTTIPSTGTNPRAIPTGAKWYSLLYATNTGYIDDSTKTALQNAQIIAAYGDTVPTSFEPYGYKIPILTNQQTIDIYIGDLPLLKSLDGTAVDEISNGTLTRRVDSDGSVLPTPTTTQITMPSIPTTDGANSITVDTTVQPSEFTATWTGWHDSSAKEYDGTNWQ